jgi:hypothetical protein
MRNIEPIDLNVEGFVKITDLNSGKVLNEGKNAIHKENFAEAISLALTTGNSLISEMHFGNGASIIDLGKISYRPARSAGSNAELYRPIYFKVVDSSDFNNGNKFENFVKSEHITGSGFADINIVCTLDFIEPLNDTSLVTGGFTKPLSISDQDNAPGEGVMWFDEIGLKSKGAGGVDTGKLLTHYRFHPIQKTENMRIEVAYTLRIKT